MSLLTSISDLNLLPGDFEPKPETCIDPHVEALVAEVGEYEIPEGDTINSGPANAYFFFIWPLLYHLFTRNRCIVSDG